MPIVFNESAGTISGISVGGLPDGIVDTDMLANDAVTDAKENLSGAAKVWIKMNGTGTIAINDSFGVSSIDDLGTGYYRINFSTAFSNANYCPSTALASYSLGDSDRRYPLHINSVATGNLTVLQGEVANNSTYNDGNFICVVVFGDQ